MASTKRIGFVDYDLENYHANVYLKMVRNDLAARGHTVAGATGMKRKAGQAWCRGHDVPWFDSVTDMNEHVDFYAVLAPSNPRVHMDLCKQVLPFGKPTYVDKTFAPDRATARKIFALADRHKVPMQTSSALRYTAVQRRAAELGMKNLRHMVAWGGGRSFEEYAIHPVEMTVSVMGPRATRLMRRGAGKQSQLLIDFTAGRTAVVNVYTGHTPFAASLTTRSATELIHVDGGRLFLDTAAAILDFYEAAKPTIDRKESLAVRRILDVAATPAARKRFVAL